MCLGDAVYDGQAGADVRLRKVRIGLGGTKLARSRPASRSWQSHCCVLDVGLASGDPAAAQRIA
jgi:hypothetical protein